MSAPSTLGEAHARKKVFRVHVDQVVEVTIDQAKFDETFMRGFRDSFYDFDTLEDHARHIAQLYARNMLRPFTEGYGSLVGMGIEVDTPRGKLETEIVS